MPLTPKGRKILSAMVAKYGKKRGTRVFYAAEKSGRLRGVRAKRRTRR